jgi:hypothetical protein
MKTLLIKFSNRNVPITFTKNQQKTWNFSFIRLAINGNEILSTLGHYRDIGVSFPFFDQGITQRFGSGNGRTNRNLATDIYGTLRMR